MVTLLNRRRCTRRGLVLAQDGRIILRSRPCRILGLQEGDGISFAVESGQVYVYKDPTPAGLRLSGRTSQLHCCSVGTVRNIVRYIPGLQQMPDTLELVTSEHPVMLSVSKDVSVPALAVINRL